MLGKEERVQGRRIPSTEEVPDPADGLGDDVGREGAGDRFDQSFIRVSPPARRRGRSGCLPPATSTCRRDHRHGDAPRRRHAGRPVKGLDHPHVGEALVGEIGNAAILFRRTDLRPVGVDKDSCPFHDLRNDTTGRTRKTSVTDASPRSLPSLQRGRACRP